MAEKISAGSAFICPSAETGAYFGDVFPDYPVSWENLSVVGFGNMKALVARVNNLIIGCEQMISVYKREVREARSDMRKIEIKHVQRSNFDRCQHLNHLKEALMFLEGHYRESGWKVILPQYRTFNHFAFKQEMMISGKLLPGHDDSEPDWFPGIALGRKHFMVYHRPSISPEDTDRYRSLEPFVVCLDENLQHFVFRQYEFDLLRSDIFSGEDSDFIACFHSETVKRLRDGSVLQLSGEELATSYTETVARLLRAYESGRSPDAILDMARIKRVAKAHKVAFAEAERLFD